MPDTTGLRPDELLSNINEGDCVLFLDADLPRGIRVQGDCVSRRNAGGSVCHPPGPFTGQDQLDRIVAIVSLSPTIRSVKYFIVLDPVRRDDFYKGRESALFGRTEQQLWRHWTHSRSPSREGPVMLGPSSRSMADQAPSFPFATKASCASTRSR
jgi:hypothetical protein